MTKESKEKKRILIGYSLSKKKIETFITPSFVTQAKNKGIDLIHVDLYQPFLQHPPYDYLIHKPYTENWNLQLLDFQTKHPNVLIIDSPSAIERVNNRVSMLNSIPNLTIPQSSSSKAYIPSFGIPLQKVLQKENNDIIDSYLSLRFPLVAKPLIAESHELSLVFNSAGLQKLKQKAPLVLQEFVNHGGVMFKVYVAGRHVKCVQRNSLPDIELSSLSVEQLKEGFSPFTRVSRLPTTSTDSSDQTVCFPPSDFVHKLAAAVREATQLHLFNFDLIRDVSNFDGNRYLIIDINYFPGYEKLQGFEAMLINFFLDVVHKNETA